MRSFLAFGLVVVSATCASAFDLPSHPLRGTDTTSVERIKNTGCAERGTFDWKSGKCRTTTDRGGDSWKKQRADEAAAANAAKSGASKTKSK